MGKHTLLISAACVFAFSTGIQAGSNINDPISTCTPSNCGSQTITGSLKRVPENFVAEVYAGAGECVRFEITATTPSFDPAMVVIGPSYSDGVIWIDDDSGSGLFPRIAIIAPVNGWYTVVVNEYNRADRGKDFTLRYGRYNGTNPNCAVLTPAELMESAVSEEK